MKYSPATDGIDHINIYSRGRTALGRALSNFAHSPFRSPFHGRFQSMEGYYYWVATGFKHDKLRTAFGSSAKQYGKTLERVNLENFQSHLIHGLECKMVFNRGVADALSNICIPLTHYYFYGEVENAKVIEVSNSDWLIYGYEFFVKRYSIVGKSPRTYFETFCKIPISDVNDLGLDGV